MATTEVEIRTTDMSDVGIAAREILANRRDEIKNDRLDGQFWFATILRQANDIVRRRRSWTERTR